MDSVNRKRFIGDKSGDYWYEGHIKKNGDRPFLWEEVGGFFKFFKKVNDIKNELMVLRKCLEHVRCTPVVHIL
jgi:hypothetical protein